MLTLSYGYKKPETDDTGDVFDPGMAANMQQLNDHTHDGSNSALLAAATQNISSASWASVSGQPGTYSQTVTMTAGYTFDSKAIQFRLSTGTLIFPSVTRASATTYVIYTNDNTLNLVALYTS